MSLILDALRKADSERERESVPGLHTQMPAMSLEDVAPPPRTTPWKWIALAAIVLLAGALLWTLFGRSAAPPPAAAARAPEATPAPPMPAPNALSPNTLQPPLQPPPQPRPIAPEPVRDVAPPAPWPDPERKGARAPAKGETAAAPTLQPLYVREQLPDAVRAALPPLVVGGSIYSSTPANRTLILDGRLYRENDPVANDLVLEEIGAKAAVLRARGYRFEIRY